MTLDSSIESGGRACFHMVRFLSALFLALQAPSARDSLLAADRAAARALASALAQDVLLLAPRASLARGRAAALPLVDSSARTPVFAAVSADARFGYTWGWTMSAARRGKYLACWRR